MAFFDIFRLYLACVIKLLTESYLARVCAHTRKKCKTLWFYQVRKMWPLAEPSVIIHSQHFYPWLHRRRLCYLATQTESILN